MILREQNLVNLCEVFNKRYACFSLETILHPISDEEKIAKTIKKYYTGYVCGSVEDIILALQKDYQKFLKRQNIMIYQEVEFLKN